MDKNIYDYCQECKHIRIGIKKDDVIGVCVKYKKMLVFEKSYFRCCNQCLEEKGKEVDKILEYKKRYKGTIK